MTVFYTLENLNPLALDLNTLGRIIKFLFLVCSPREPSRTGTSNESIIMSEEKDVVLSRIRESEKKAEELLAAARAQADEIVAASKKESLRVLRNGEASISGREVAKLAAAEKEIRAMRDALVAEGGKNADKLRQSAGRNVTPAVDSLFENFLRKFQHA